MNKVWNNFCCAFGLIRRRNFIAFTLHPLQTKNFTIYLLYEAFVFCQVLRSIVIFPRWMHNAISLQTTRKRNATLYFLKEDAVVCTSWAAESAYGKNKAEVKYKVLLWAFGMGIKCWCFSLKWASQQKKHLNSISLAYFWE